MSSGFAVATSLFPFLNALADDVSKNNMNSSRVGKATFRLTLVTNLCAFAIGINLARIASGAETMPSLYRSTDQGASWFQVGQGLPSDERINALSIAGEVVVAGTDRGIFISRDGGAKWRSAQQGIGTESRVLCLTTQAGRVFAGTHKRGVIVSEDEGMNWKVRSAGLTDLYVRSLLSVGTKLYAGTDGDGVFVSGNDGVLWNNQRTGLPDSSQVFDLASLGGTVFAGLYSKGLYRWDAAPGRWVSAGRVAPLELVTIGETLVVGHNPGGIFVSEDRGRTWSDGNSGLPVNAPTWTLAASDDQVFLGTSGKVGIVADDIGLFASKDHGKSWTRSDAGLPAGSAAISFVVTKQFILAGISLQKLKSEPPLR